MAKPLAATVGQSQDQGYSARLDTSSNSSASAIEGSGTDDTTEQPENTDDPQAEDIGEEEAAESGTDEARETEVEAGETPDSEEEPAPSAEAEEEDQVEPDEDLLTPEERKLAAADPKKLEKLLRRNYTQKTQKLAADRKQLEQYSTFVQQLMDPVVGPAKLAELAKRHGQNLTPATSVQADDIVSKAKAQIIARGADAEAVETILPLIEAVARTIVQPMNHEITTIRQRAAEEATLAASAAFKSKHPDYIKYGSELASMIEQMPQGANVSTEVYLERIYNLVVPQTAKVRKGVEKTIDKINRGARASKARPAAASVPGNSRVQKKSQGNSIEDFWNEAEEELAAEAKPRNRATA